MRNIVIIYYLLINSTLFSQAEIKSYKWEEVIHSLPDTIYSVTFEKLKIKELPIDLKRFKNIKVLNLSKNNLSELPSFIQEFEKLEVIYLDKNKFTEFPSVLLNNKNLKELYLSRNEITVLPDEIDQLSELVKLDLWSTAITYFPPSIVNLKKVQFIDLRGVTYGPTFIKEITTSMNWVTFKYETPCSCVE